MQLTVDEQALIGSASDLWLALIAQAGLDIDHYDSAIVEEIRGKLLLPPGDMAAVLEADPSVSTDDLVVAFFEAVEPFARMMTDLLVMFERAGASRGDANLLVDFDFSTTHRLSFDLRNFRTWLETWTRISGAGLARLWDYHAIWRLHEILRSDGRLQDDLALRWLTEYEDGIWPTVMPAPPASGLRDLDAELRHVWRVWTTVVSASSSFGRQRADLQRRAQAESRDEHALRGDEVVNGEDVVSEGGQQWTPGFLAHIDGDRWAGSVLRCAYAVADSTQRDERRGHNVAARLHQLFQGLPRAQTQVECLVRCLAEFLSLPVWQQRYELYSAWVSTQLVDALGQDRVRVHSAGGKLAFSFSGTHLATVDTAQPKLHIWAELRSPLSDPLGHGRRRAIQPDYSIVTDPITSPESSIVVVECKQYLKASRRRFADALRDYAKGRPNAHVVLVNYGEADGSIAASVDPEFRRRISVIGEMRPGSDRALAHFKALVGGICQPHYAPAALVRAPGRPADGDAGIVRLAWGGEPSDLDLHLRIGSRNGSPSREISYEDMGSLDEEPWAELDDDVTSGEGPETIRIKRWVPAVYECAVCRYDGSVPLAGSGATLVYRDGGTEMRFECPTEGEGDWWHVFRLDARSGAVEVTHRITDDPW